MRPLSLLKVEGYGATTHRWLAPLTQHLQQRLPTLAIRHTTWNTLAPADLDHTDILLGRSYGIAAAVRALHASTHVLPLLLALDPVPRWIWGQFTHWTLPPTITTTVTWFQRNLFPMGEPFTLVPNSAQSLTQIDLSARGLTHTSLPSSPEIAAQITALLQALAASPDPVPIPA